MFFSYLIYWLKSTLNPAEILRERKNKIETKKEWEKIEKVKPVINKFVRTTVLGKSRWPQKIDFFFQKDDLKILQKIIGEMENEFVHRLDLLEKACLDILYELNLDKFVMAFEKESMILEKKGDMTWGDLAEEYAKLFGGEIDYISYLIKYGKKEFGLSEISFTAFYDLINEKIILLRAKKIRLEMETDKAIRSLTINDLDNLSGLEFEKILETLFNNMGYMVKRTAFSGDQGADLILEKNGEKFAVQAKRTNTSVGNSAVQEVVSALKYYDCDYGIVVTNSNFTKSAIVLAESNDVELWDREKTSNLIQSFL